MTVQEYLEQAMAYEKYINENMEKIEELREEAYSLASPSFEQSYSATRNTSSPYEMRMEKLNAIENKVSEEIAILVALKNQINTLTESIADENERKVIRLKYLSGLKLIDIANFLKVNRSTVSRWHKRALQQLVLPSDYIEVLF